MKKIYLTLLIAFLGGQVIAQSMTSSQTNKTNKTNVIKGTELLTDLPGFPAYQNTGNKELDNSNYSIAKQNWINANKETYDAYISKLSGNNSPAWAGGNFKELPGFPQYVNTGNEELDRANYDAAKEKWIIENQELYNQCINSTK